MPACGVTLQALTLRGLAPAVAQALGLRGIDVAAGPGPALSAVLDTPRGPVTLASD
jgi:hypothetical protein